MKSAISIAFLFLLSFHLAGFYLVFSHQKNQVRSEIKQRIKNNVPEEELSLIKLSTAELDQLQWKDRHEFWYQGDLYDIVRKVAKGDSLTFYCINDEQETLLFSKLENWVQRHHNGEKNGTVPVKLMQQLFSLFSPPQGVLSWDLYVERNGPLPIFFNNFQSRTTETPSPPPKGLS